MKTTITTLKKLMLIALFTLISSSAFAATYYVCNGATLNVAPAAITDITYSYDVKQGGISLPTYPNATAPTSLPAAGIYEVLVISTYTGSDPAVCAPDVATNTIIVLPTLATLTTAAPTKSTYCESASGSFSNIALTGTTPSLPADVTGPPAAPYSTDLELEYVYSVVRTFNAVTDAAVDGSTVGTVNQSTGAFSLTTDIPGSYAITATVKYKNKTGFVNTLLNASGCPAPASSVQTVVVTAKPNAPAITITAN